MTTAAHRGTRRVSPAPAAANGSSALSGMDLLAHLPTDVVSTSMAEVTVHGLGALDLVDIGPRAAALEDDDEVGQIKLMVDVVALGLDIPAADAGRLPIPVIKPLFTAIARLSGLDESAAAEAAESLKATPNDES